MEFLKILFNGEAITFEQLAEKVKAEKLNIVDLSQGEYVSRDKYDNKTGTLNQQITDLQGQITQRDADMNDLKTKLADAQADAGKLGAVQQSLSDLQTKYDADKQSYESKLSKQAYEFAVKEKASGLKFSSNGAKRAFVQDAIEKGFTMDGDTLLGFDDYVAKYKTDDPDAFKADDDPKPGTPAIVLPTGKQPVGGKAKSLAEMMKAKNENPSMEINFDNQ